MAGRVEGGSEGEYHLLQKRPDHVVAAAAAAVVVFVAVPVVVAVVVAKVVSAPSLQVA